jgi:peptidyl-prolyl cis-trans isomerase B (cyclophilin B)
MTRREAIALGGALALALPSMPSSASADEPPPLTHKVFLDVGIAPTALKPSEERTLGSRTSIPVDDAQPIGRIVLGLYGSNTPVTVDNFLALVRSGVLKETVFSRVLPGEYIQAGQQGSRRMGQIEQRFTTGLVQNREVSESTSFKLNHNRPGTLSLSLSENDEDPSVKARQGYLGSLEFLITTGPGPCPRLDGLNIPFGRVLEGMGVVERITRVPTFRANDRTSALNILAGQLGDDRAAGVRRKYGKPLMAVVILDAGELPLEG